MKLLAIDGNSIMNRAYYGIRALTNKKGVYTNAIMGFMNIYLKNFDEVKPDAAAVAFDLKKPTFRHSADVSYKANRKPMPEELAMQMPLIKEILAAMGIRVLECEGYEADDVLGTLSKMCTDTGNECFILTGDRDSLQLVNESVTVRLATTKETIVYTPERFFEEYGFEPLSLIDLKALMGDSSDNIKGVAGIGKKTAGELIARWKTIEAVYENIDSAGLSKGVYTKLVNGKKDAEHSKWLATIVLDAPVDTDPESYMIGKPDNERISELLTELEMFRLLSKLKLSPSAETPKKPEKETLPEAEFVQTEFSFDKIKAAERVYYTLADGVLRVCIMKSDTEGELSQTGDSAVILDFLESDVKKVTFGAKPHYHFMLENGREIKRCDFDCEIAAYLIDPSVKEYIPQELCSSMEAAYPEGQGEFADAAALSGLYKIMSEKIKEQSSEFLLYEVEQPLTEVLASMEHFGVAINSDGVRSFGRKLKEEMDKLQSDIYTMADTEFNISSPKQLGDVLYQMGVPLTKKTKNGYSTSAGVLEEFRYEYPIVEQVLRYRQLAKLDSTYVEGLLKKVSADGRIHSVFRQTETRTGRISSTEPNLQNIPVRTELGREMRKFFIADRDRIFLDADYSQIELRIVAHVCDDPVMIKGFNEGADIHASTAAQVFNMPPEMVTSQMRSAAKAVNFGIIYGIGAFSLSKNIGVSIQQAKKYIKSYFEKFPNIRAFMDDVIDTAAKRGYVETMFGRRRYVPELTASNKLMQAAGKRIAMNTPIQGSAADIIKMAMIRVYSRLRREVPEARLILQIHDELIVECSERDADRAAEILAEEMQSAAKLRVPLTADVNRGRSWYDAKG